MDDSNASTILVSVFKAVFRGLVVLSAYTWTLLYSVLYVITWPVLSVSNGLLSIALLPLRILLKFEAILTFGMVAAITGATVGICLYLTGDFLSRVFLLSSSDHQKPMNIDSLKIEDSTSTYDWESKMYLSSTILEEEETSQDSRDE
ncbi:hypothetical protein POX_c04694 [Penicillium oxalicum]|uniref:Uncharacterized protein n=1 Tax=Penicillium oxalicum (strain 114-2 / CGMCC 5302) TaxID=933388 RepID=S8AK75_PENO1|nr:hypothetical protein POX_c04694 [Penicillium oxalicum]EPS26228.1 hypothetical protein PDE_01164 [Penicillium oxalicum 114-2]KAI2791815.1 hypothetical protein POX_c04694 [Penicillium oxalicum]